MGFRMGFLMVLESCGGRGVEVFRFGAHGKIGTRQNQSQAGEEGVAWQGVGVVFKIRKAGGVDLRRIFDDKRHFCFETYRFENASESVEVLRSNAQARFFACNWCNLAAHSFLLKVE